MNISTGWKKVKMKIGKSTITAEFKPLKTASMIKLMGNAIFDEGKDQMKAALSGMEMQAFAVEVFPEHVRNIEGLTVDDAPVTFEQLSTEAQLMTVTTRFFTELINLSMLKGEEVKN